MFVNEQALIACLIAPPRLPPLHPPHSPAPILHLMDQAGGGLEQLSK